MQDETFQLTDEHLNIEIQEEESREEPGTSVPESEARSPETDEQVFDLKNIMAESPTDDGNAKSEDEIEPSESFPVDALPGVLKDFVVEVANSIGIDPAFVAVPMLSVVSGTMGRLFQLELKKDFSVLPTIWTAVVASSGTGKTPALSKVLEPIRHWQKLLNQGYKRNCGEYEKYLKRCQDQKRKQQANCEPSLEKPMEPTFERLLVDDVTVEAMAEIFEQNPFGVIRPQDELFKFLRSFDIYSGGKGGMDLAFWLCAFDGTPFPVDRKTGRKHIFAPTPSVAITGGIQPGMLRESFQKNQQFLDSGLAARFVFAMPQNNPIMWSDDEISDEVKDRYTAIFDRLVELRQSGNILPEYPIEFSLSPEAFDLYRAFYDANATEQVELYSDSARATWAKLPMYAAKIALVFHVVERIESGKIPKRVSEETMSAAVQVTNWFKGEAVRILQTMAKDQGKISKYHQAETRILETIHGRICRQRAFGGFYDVYGQTGKTTRG